MKKIFSKVLISGLALVLMSGTALPAFATDTVAGFDDVKTKDWFYEPVMLCTQKGAISGVRETDANGITSFDPEGKVTLGQFLTVLTRLLCPTQIPEKLADENWAAPYWKAAINAGIITAKGYPDSKLGTNLTREEMAEILVAAAKVNGETMTALPNIKNNMADYGQISFSKQEAVKAAYSNGLLSGYSNGNFGPNDTMTRGQMARVVCSLMGYLPRSEVKVNETPQKPTTQTPTTSTGNQTFREGQAHNRPQVGDTVIKSDGTQITIEKGIGGVLGAGQGVNIWSGVVQEGKNLDNYYNGVDKGKDMTSFKTDSITSEMHSAHEWEIICSSSDPTNKLVGDFDGEIYQNWWKWDANLLGTGAWIWIGP